jgi:HD-GYP domain-containing protein (c-di-GMP phosphodiesterase class II)
MANETVDVLTGFRRRLISRLIAAGLLASMLAGVAAYFIETERLDETLVDQAALEARTLSAALNLNGGETGNDDKLKAFLQEHSSTSRDFFVLAEVYDIKHQSAGEAALPHYDFIDPFFNRTRHPFPELGSSWYTKSVINGSPYLQVMVPLSGADGRLNGWFEGIYRLSPETLEAIQTDIIQIIALVAGAVLLTAGVLYPLMNSLQGHIVATAKDLLRSNIDTLKVLGSAIAKRDSDTHAHNFRVTVYAVRIAQAMGLEDGAIRSLIKGSFLHDVGKIAVPDAILLKPGKLDETEFAEMKTHVVHGLDIIAASNWLKDAADVVGSHHEKVDGSGYPQGLAKDTVPLAARIFAVADVFDALTSERPYKKPMTPDMTMAILEEGRGRHFDGAVLDAFTSLMPHIHDDVARRSDAEVEALTETLLGRYFRV